MATASSTFRIRSSDCLILNVSFGHHQDLGGGETAVVAEEVVHTANVMQLMG